ncbi:MAG: hypothetical protein AAF614_02090 [Chloroflexota bacterium]
MLGKTAVFFGVRGNGRFLLNEWRGNGRLLSNRMQGSQSTFFLIHNNRPKRN